MTCRRCGYRNDFLDKCPFHEKPLEERIKDVRIKIEKEKAAEVQRLIEVAKHKE